MIVCIVGPTGVGKTKLSEELSLKYDAIIVNSDSMQVYKEMDIGTAKYTDEEDLGRPHLLFDIVSPKDMYTVYDYQRDFRKVVEEYENRNIVMVGGTGLYIKAALFKYEFEEKTSLSFDEYTNEELYEMLKEKDSLDGIHINNRRRMISRLSSSKNNALKDEPFYEDVYFIGLTTDREKLYSKIDKRVDVMMEDGLLEEVKRLYEKYGLTKSMKTGIGYKELVAYLRGLMTYEEAVRLIKSRSRKYAKRQYTWFNNQMDIAWFEVDYENFENTIDAVVKYIETKQNSCK